MKMQLCTINDIADTLGVSLSRAYVLKCKDKTFPPVAQRLGTRKFFRVKDVDLYARRRERAKHEFDFG